MHDIRYQAAKAAVRGSKAVAIFVVNSLPITDHIARIYYLTIDHNGTGRDCPCLKDVISMYTGLSPCLQGHAILT